MFLVALDYLNTCNLKPVHFLLKGNFFFFFCGGKLKPKLLELLCCTDR